MSLSMVKISLAMEKEKQKNKISQTSPETQHVSMVNTYFQSFVIHLSHNFKYFFLYSSKASLT